MLCIGKVITQDALYEKLKIKQGYIQPVQKNLSITPKTNTRNYISKSDIVSYSKFCPVDIKLNMCLINNPRITK